ncbi:MAG: aspartate aminotransferase, partial [Proteobacteria bacterium]
MAEPRYDFHTPAAREVTGGLKWGRYAGRDILPMWVADMDFFCPPTVLEALRGRVDEGVFGYGSATGDQVDAVLAALWREFAWEVQPEWLVWLPGLVTGITQACRAFGEAGDEVLVNTPVYPPFLKAPGWVGRRCVAAPLAGDNTVGWRLDAEAMGAAITDRTALYLLCHPHNPVGRMWTEDELDAAAAVCLENDVVICSDEIHNQLILTTDRRHRPLATLSPEIAARSISLLAPSKTFNITGLGCSLAVIPDRDLRQRFEGAGQG